jgi:hypothetical protein
MSGFRYRIPALVLAAASLLFLSTTRGESQSQRYRAPRTADGRPDISGIWQANNTANWDIQAHPAKASPVVALGASFSIPPGLGVVEGGELPYTPAALKQKKDNEAHWVERDPEIKCYMPGIPRATYEPHPFQIVQSPATIVMAYEFASASRIIYMTGNDKAPADSWMGWSHGSWDGETLVIDVTSLNDLSWFDRAGDFHSNAMHVVERYTRVSPEVLEYEATIDDPKTFTRPWKMSMPLYRRAEKNAQLLEYKCVELVDELMYGAVRKRSQ